MTHRTLGVLAVILAVSVLMGAGGKVALSFSGPPPGSPGTTDGVIRYDAGTKNIGISTAPASDTKFLIQSGQAKPFGIRDSSGAQLFDVAISTPNSTTTVYGNLVVLGTISGILTGLELPAGNISTGVFGEYTTAPGSPYAFPAQLGVGTSTAANIPRTLSVYGDAYVSSSLYVGSASIPGGIGTTKVYVAGPIATQAMFDSAQAPTTPPMYTFDSDRDTGIYHVSNNEIGFMAEGTRLATIRRSGNSNEGILGFPLGGTENDPAIAVGYFLGNGAGGGGMYSPGTGILAFVTGGVDNSIERMRLVSSTGVGIHTKTPQYTLDVNGGLRLMETSTAPLASNGAMFFDSSAGGGTGKFRCYENGWKDCIGSGGGISGSGSNGRIARFNNISGTSIGNSVIYETSTNIGIGALPSSGARLEVIGQIHSTSGGFKFPDSSVQTTAFQSIGAGVRNSGALATQLFVNRPGSTIIPFDFEVYDNGGLFTPAAIPGCINVSPCATGLTITKTGKYLLTAVTGYPPTSGGWHISTSILRTSPTLDVLARQSGKAENIEAGNIQNVSVVAQLTQGDVVAVQVSITNAGAAQAAISGSSGYNTGGTNEALDGPEFSVQWIAP